MKISVCVDAVFSGEDFVESLKEISGASLDTFEFWSWWDKDLEHIQKTQEELGLTAAACCTRFISLVDASKRSEYLRALRESIQAAKQIGCKTLITQVGDDLGSSRYAQKRNLIAGLKASVPLLENADMLLVFEPLNTLVDHPGYYLTSSEEAFEIVEAVGSPRVKVLFDIYHQQIMEGNLIQRIRENIDKIGHFHAAGNPGRNEPYYGEINYPELFRAIDETGYQGYVGFEYVPVDAPLKGILAFVENK